MFPPQPDHHLRSPPPLSHPFDEMETLLLSESTSFHPLSSVPVSDDPLQNPKVELPSPSRSSFLDPLSYDDAVLTPENGNHSDSSSPSSSLSRGSSSRWNRPHTSLYRKITVGSPQKEQETTNSLVPVANTYVTYLITTRISSDGGEFSVRRRFKDFVTLADRLAENYRGLFIPVRPDKNLVESQVMQKQEFVDQRRSALEKYLWRLAAHPMIGKSDELRVFLMAPGKLPLLASIDVASRVLHGAVRLPRQLFGEVGARSVAPEEVVQPAKGGRDLLRMFRELKQSMVNDWVGVKPDIVEEDKEFLERKEKVHVLEQQLSTASEQAETLTKAQQDIGETMGELGLIFIKLSNFETKEAIYNSQRIRASDARSFGTATVKVSRFYRELNTQTLKHLDALHEYLGFMLSVHNAFSDRASALLTVQTLLSDLSSLQTRAEKLEAASSKMFGVDRSRIQKIEELKETIRSTEDAKHIALKEYERIKENNKNELERLDRERRDDFFCMLKAFVISQVGYAEKIASSWEKVVEDTSGYLKPSV